MYWNWGPEYARIVEGSREGTWRGGWEYFDADSGALGLFGFIGLIFGPLLVNYIILLFRIYTNEFIDHKTPG